MRKWIAALSIALSILWAWKSIAGPVLQQSIGQTQWKLWTALKWPETNLPVDKTLYEIGIINWFNNRDSLVILLTKAWLISFPTNSDFPKWCNTYSGYGELWGCSWNFYRWEPGQNTKLEEFIKKNNTIFKENSTFINDAITFYQDLVIKHYEDPRSEDVSNAHLNLFQKDVDDNSQLVEKIGQIKKIFSR